MNPVGIMNFHAPMKFWKDQKQINTFDDWWPLLGHAIGPRETPRRELARFPISPRSFINPFKDFFVRLLWLS
jgi:hypothetical protein